jgi:hypothetical protein
MKHHFRHNLPSAEHLDGAINGVFGSVTIDASSLKWFQSVTIAFGHG